MIAVVVVLAVVAGAAVALALTARRRLAAASTALAEARVALEASVAERGRAGAAETELRSAVSDLERRLDEAQRHAAEAVSRGRPDAEVLWALELRRSERLWRHSVSPGPQVAESPLSDQAALPAALQIELDAAREEIGAVVDLVADLPEDLDAATSLLTLRLAQELIADVVRRSESTTLRAVAVDGDVAVVVDAVGVDGEMVRPEPLPLESPAFTVEPDGVRIHRTVADAGT
jgi:hypothetical protein